MILTILTEFVIDIGNTDKVVNAIYFKFEKYFKMYKSRYIILYSIISSQVNVMHPAPGGVHDQWKWSTNSDEISCSNIAQKISPPEPLCCGRRSGIAGTFRFEKYFNEL